MWYLSNRSKIVESSTVCLLVLLGLTLMASPTGAQVFDLGPSDSALFETVINVPSAPDIGNSAVIGGDGSATQVNVSEGGSIAQFVTAESGTEVNIRGGSVGGFLMANSGSEVNVAGGEVGAFFQANDGSVVNISGGAIAVGLDADSGSVVNITGGVLNGFTAGSGSVVNFSGGIGSSYGNFASAESGGTVNLIGINFVLDGVSLNGDLNVGEPVTIVDRAVTLSGQFADGTPFSFNLNPNPPVFEPSDDYFDPGATLTVTLQREVIIGDGDGDGLVTFLDIDWFIGVLQSRTYVAEADINQDGFVDFLDIAPLIALLAGN